jgi:hypothetical protein
VLLKLQVPERFTESMPKLVKSVAKLPAENPLMLPAVRIFHE